MEERGEVNNLYFILKLTTSQNQKKSKKIKKKIKKKSKNQIKNRYGSTETTADATFLECVREEEKEEGKRGEWGWMDGDCKSVPVGRPAPNTIGLVKVGEEKGVGELYMAGLSGFSIFSIFNFQFSIFIYLFMFLFFF